MVNFYHWQFYLWSCLWFNSSHWILLFLKLLHSFGEIQNSKVGLVFDVTKCNSPWGKFKLFFPLFSINNVSKLFLCEDLASKREKRIIDLQVSDTVRQNTNNFWISSAPEFHTNKKLTHIMFKRNDWKSKSWFSTFQENGYLLTMNSTSPGVTHWSGSLGSIRQEVASFFSATQNTKWGRRK